MAEKIVIEVFKEKKAEVIKQIEATKWSWAVDIIDAVVRAVEQTVLDEHGEEKKVDYDLTGSTFITIPLEEGDNIIEMSYSVPHLSSGIVLSIAGVLLLAGITYFERKKKDA